jgi:hypothetical protein
MPRSPESLQTTSQPERSYLTRLRIYASDETREYLWRDLPIEAVGAIGWGVLQGGWTLTGLAHGAIAFVILFIVAYFVHFANAPRVLDRECRQRLASAEALRETWLKLEVDTKEHLSNTGQWTKSNAVLIVDEFTIPAMSDGPITEFLLWVNLRIRFHNPGTEDNRVRKIEVSLWKITDDAEVFVDRGSMTAQPDKGGGGNSRLLDQYLVKASSTSEDYWLLNFFNLRREDRDDKTLFVKVTMQAFRQPTTTIRVRWDADMARQKSVPVKPELAALD